MADENGEKTEQPTDRRRQQVREEGNVVRSMDLNAAALLLAAAVAMQFFGASVTTSLGEYLSASLHERAWLRLDTGLILGQLWKVAQLLFSAVLPLMLVLAAFSLASNLFQVGFLVSPELLEAKLSRINPWEGLKRIFSTQGLVKLSISLGKLLLLATLVVSFIWGNLGQFLSLAGVPLESSAVSVGYAIINLAFQLSLALVVLAICDYGYQYWRFEQDLRMTKQEVRDEMRQMEGDPLIRQRRRDAHRRLATSQQVQKVREADVVVTNPTEIAVAIKYDSDTMAAPIVVAKGMGELAARIRQLAAEHAVPIIEKKPLARSLYKLVKVGHPVPVELYEAVAEIIAYVYRIKAKGKKAA